MDVTRNITKGQILRYMFMPQIVPRLNAFYSAGFANLAYLIALVYRAVNILPANHPVFHKENRDHLGLRLVLGAAASELKFTRSHIDKIVIYFVILLGLVLLAAQFFLILMYVMMNPALAATMPTTYAQFFSTPNYDKDVAYQILFRVFGVPEFFGPGKGLRPFHTAMYALFQLYSIGLLVIAIIIISYLIFAIVVETAQTGVPFGKRYNHVWAPIRLVVALGLLIPIGYGLNSAQWITLYAAKLGSDFATKGWITFNQVMTGEYLSRPYERVAKPRSPQMMSLAVFMGTVSACSYAYEKYYTGANLKDIRGYLVKNTADGGAPAADFLEKSYEEAVKFHNNGDILISFGQHDPTHFGKEVGFVFPYCGSIVIHAGDAKEPGAKIIQEHYYYLVMKMYAAYGGYQDIDKYAKDLVHLYSDTPGIRNADAKDPPPSSYKGELRKKLDADTEAKMREAVDAQTQSESWKKDQERTIELGWGGAGLWYNKIAQINGSMVTAANNVPQPQKMPEVMEFVKREQLQQNSRLPDSFKGNLAGVRPVQFDNPVERSIGKILSQVWDWWIRDDINQGEGSGQIKRTNNMFIDAINIVFGTRGLFDMCQSADVHPLAQLSVLGKGLVEASIRNLGIAVGAGAIAMLPIPFIGAAAGAASSILLSIASITITMGFVLFYVLPFMPFLYFFFAVGGWIKGLFEAMVGVPLWALAHLRIDGEGLPGDAAMSGYYLIFEIFLRPILIVFGLLASVIIFAAMVKVLNEIFSLVVVNLAGHDQNSRTLCGQLPGNTAGTGSGSGTAGGNEATAFMRGPIDELFFTIIYAIIVYMIGMSCFKLIDLVPNNILRYMSASVNTFNDTASDPAEGLITKLSVGGKYVSGQVMDIGSKAAGAVGKTIEAGQQLMPEANPKK